ncbi:MAG: DUF4388 domain-containing protein [Acidobacteriota bacterium]
MSDSGDLSATPFPLLLADHFKRGSTGALSVALGTFRKRIYLQGGRVVFAASNDRNDRLGEMLVRRGVLGLSDFLEASASMVPGKRFGALLVEREIIDGQQLVWAVTEQVKEIVFSLFGLPAGPYQFLDGQDAGDEMITLQINTPELLHQGVNRMDQIVPILGAFSDARVHLQLAGDASGVLSALTLEGTTEREVVRALAAPCELRALCASAKMPQFPLLKFLWVLLMLGYVRTTETASIPSPEAGGLPEMEITGEDLQDLL